MLFTLRSYITMFSYISGRRCKCGRIVRKRLSLIVMMVKMSYIISWDVWNPSLHTTFLENTTVLRYCPRAKLGVKSSKRTKIPFSIRHGAATVISPRVAQSQCAISEPCMHISETSGAGLYDVILTQPVDKFFPM